MSAFLAVRRDDPRVDYFYKKVDDKHAHIEAIDEGFNAEVFVTAKYVNLLNDGFNGRPRLEVVGDVSRVRFESEDFTFFGNLEQPIESRFVYHFSDDELVDWVKYGYFNDEFDMSIYTDKVFTLDSKVSTDKVYNNKVVKADFVSIYDDDEVMIAAIVAIDALPDHILLTKQHVKNYELFNKLMIESRTKEVYQKTHDEILTFYEAPIVEMSAEPIVQTELSVESDLEVQNVSEPISFEPNEIETLNQTVAGDYEAEIREAEDRAEAFRRRLFGEDSEVEVQSEEVEEENLETEIYEVDEEPEEVKFILKKAAFEEDLSDDIDFDY